MSENLCKKYFTKISAENEIKQKWKCNFPSCKKEYVRHHKMGWTNLLTHLRTIHNITKTCPITTTITPTSPTTTQINNNEKDAPNKWIDIYRWTNLIISKNLPFTCVNDPEFREFSKFGSICYNTLMK